MDLKSKFDGLEGRERDSPISIYTKFPMYKSSTMLRIPTSPEIDKQIMWVFEHIGHLRIDTTTNSGGPMRLFLLRLKRGSYQKGEKKC